MDTKAFTSFLHSNIPLTEFMDIQAETYTPEKVVLSVPFAQNKKRQKYRLCWQHQRIDDGLRLVCHVRQFP